MKIDSAVCSELDERQRINNGKKKFSPTQFSSDGDDDSLKIVCVNILTTPEMFGEYRVVVEVKIRRNKKTHTFLSV
jgi:hypothetical protein